MTFDESEVSRTADGRFAEKTGAPAEVSLTTAVPLEEALAEFRATLSQVAYGTNRDWVLRDEVLKDRAAGRRHMYDHHYATMWAGRAVNILGGHDGWSEDVVRQRLATVKRLQDDLAEERLTPNEFAINQNHDWKRDEVERWLQSMEHELNLAVETEGRSLVVNARDARQRYADFEGGGNLR